ncbi:MAG: phospholipase D family protein [Dehalococcoidia bacterium]
MAWARDDGVCLFLEAIERRIHNLEFIVGINEKGTSVEALLRILQAGASLWVFYKHPAQTFHPKIYWFDGGTSHDALTSIVVGSSNLTTGGLISNFEASLIAEISESTPSHEGVDLLASLQSVWDELVCSPYCHRVFTGADVKRFYDLGYIDFEHTLRSRRRRSARSGSPRGDLPSSPPPHRPICRPPPLDIPFAERPGPIPVPVLEDVDPPGSAVLPDRFFVRTLTATDISKLRGAFGTFEPDLGETARDRYPAFWGWPDMYTSVTRHLSRREWHVAALVFSSNTPPEGVPVSVTLWYRDAREGHAAEHRFSPRPIATFRAAVPPNFDESSILVVENSPQGASYQYVIKLLIGDDPEFMDYSTYLTETRPHHRFGYGP